MGREQEEVGSLGGDGISSKPKWFSTNSDLSLSNQLSAFLPGMLQRNWRWVSTEKMTRWETKSQGSSLTCWALANHCRSLGPCSLLRRMGELDDSMPGRTFCYKWNTIGCNLCHLFHILPLCLFHFQAASWDWNNEGHVTTHGSGAENQTTELSGKRMSGWKRQWQLDTSLWERFCRAMALLGFSSQRENVLLIAWTSSGVFRCLSTTGV